MAGKNGGGVAVADGTLGERVRTARKALAMSQAQLAGDELTKGFISQLESGSVRPSIRSLQIIASRLGKTLEYFLGDAPLATGRRLAFHRLAAETAAEQRDWARVREHVQLGLAEPADATERAQFLCVLAQAENAAHSYERTFELVSDALSLVRVDAEPQLVAMLLFLRGVAYGEVGQLGAATEAIEASRDVIEKHEVLDPRLRSRVMVALGTVYRRLKRSSKAMASYEAALAAASRSSELVLAARGYMGIAATHYDAGDLDAAIATYRRALELFQRVSDVEHELGALQSIAIVQFENGDVAAAKASAERAFHRAIEAGSSHWAAVVEIILARVALAEQRVDDALRMAQHGEKVIDESGDRIQQADALGAIGAAYEALGRTAEADRSYRASLDLYTKIGDLADRSGMAAEYARLLKARGEIDAAFEMLELARGGVTRS